MKHANGCWGHEVGAKLGEVGKLVKKFLLKTWKFGDEEVRLVDVGL